MNEIGVPTGLEAGKPGSPPGAAAHEVSTVTPPIRDLLYFFLFFWLETRILSLKVSGIAGYYIDYRECDGATGRILSF